MGHYEGSMNVENEDYAYHNLYRKIDPWDFDTQTGLLVEHNRPTKEWGTLIHPHELRQILFVGNGRLITTSGDQIHDYQLKNWIDLTVESFSQQIQFDIYPRLYRHRPLPQQSPRTIEPYAEWDDLYDYNPSEANYFFVKLRRKPILKLHKWLLAFPYTGNKYIDLSKQAIIRHWQGILKAVFVRVPWSNIAPVQTGINAWRGLMHGYAQLPGGYQIDYTTGFDHASRVPAELKEQIMKLITINVMSAYGDGILGGMANYSTSVSVLSESVGTTMSATSAWYGARIKQLTDEIQAWWKQRRSAYGGVTMTSI
jgi:hypothetical protein